MAAAAVVAVVAAAAEATRVDWPMGEPTQTIALIVGALAAFYVGVVVLVRHASTRPLNTTNRGGGGGCGGGGGLWIGDGEGGGEGDGGGCGGCGGCGG